MFQNLERLVEERGLNLYVVANRAGLSPSTLYNWKACKRVPTYRVCQKLATFFDVPVSTFYDPDKAQLDVGDRKQSRSINREKFKEIETALIKIKVTSYEEAIKYKEVAELLVLEPTTVEDVAKNLCVLMYAYKISTPQLAKKLDILHSTVCNWRKGTHAPRRASAKLMAEFFKAPIQLFLVPVEEV